ncbi:Conjugal transfer protein TrbG/VirB9/CagX [mine drainage metagenome]|uniref:Conjugal transfer protein TrbG/VirB9/CagX n=1 Tax=mine drainage metagenome TaxID=410659 RepID=T1AYZ9_9ZZZZ
MSVIQIRRHVLIPVLMLVLGIASKAIEAQVASRYSVGRVIHFHYRAGRSYTILARPDAVTDLILPSGEHPENLALGDTVRWVVAQDAQDVYLKPVRAGLFTSATLLTNRRRYELILVSVPAGSPWYQAVSWSQHTLWALHQGLATRRAQTARKRPRKTHPSVRMRWYRNVDAAYRISGRATWRPLQVFDDGQETFIELAPTVQVMPALFVRQGRHVTLVNYRVSGHWIIFPGRFRVAELRLGHRTIRIRRFSRRAS